MLLSDQAVLTIVCLFSLPHLVRLLSLPWKRGARPGALQAWYEDIDGKGTPETVADFSAALRRAKLACVLVALAGTAVSAASLFLPRGIPAAPPDPTTGDNFSSRSPWFGLAIWLALVLQTTAISTGWSGTAYGLGLVSFFGALPAVALHLARLATELSWKSSSVPRPHEKQLVPAIVEALLVVASVAFAAACLAIPRKPYLRDDQGRLVDIQFSITGLNRFTWSWISDIIKMGKEKGDLEPEDIFRPDYGCSARGLVGMWRDYDNLPLWAAILANHRGMFLIEQLFAMATGVSRMVPAYCVLRLLELIETGRRGSPQAMLWAVALFGAIGLNEWICDFFWQLIWNRMYVPIRSQLTALVFEKVLQAKDIKSVPAAAAAVRKSDGDGDDGDGDGDKKKKQKQKAGPGNDGQEEDEGSGEEGEGKFQDDDDDDGNEKKKSHSNVIGVDVERVAHFTATNIDLLAFPLVSTIAAFYMLNTVLGWRPLVMSFITILAFTWANVINTRRYSRAETAVMKARDGKMAVISEAVRGIRQIKFSAMEARWQARINDVRDKELGHLWKSMVADIIMTVTGLALPIVLAIVSFTAYCFFEGQLKASVAFSSIAIFNEFNATLYYLPNGIQDCFNAIISVRRLQAYLAGQNVNTVRSPGTTRVEFQGASVSWPVDEPNRGRGKDKDTDDNEDDASGPGRFVLRDITASFPEAKLSVIAGKTGSGKSLMLASILGESDVLEGTVAVPGAPETAARDDRRATAENWLLPTAMAYVAQIPWIENASVHDNVLFGLPLDRTRLDATIEACALKKDIDDLPDGELTEIGANGINISGGQRWRLSLARAVYSRAGILVLDDIFSAVDVHVGRHIARECLGGPLCRDRTVILVTHHISICRTLTAYLVELGDGGVLKYAGPVDETSSKLLAVEQEEEEEAEDESRRRRKSRAGSNAQGGGGGGSIDDVAGSEAGEQEQARDPGTKPRVLVEDEKREVGAVKRSIYLTYFSYSGGWPYVCILFTLFSAVQALVLGRTWWVKIWTSSIGPDGGNETAFGGRDYDASSYMVVQGREGGAHAPPYQLAVPSGGTGGTGSTGSMDGRELAFYLGIYAALSVAVVAFDSLLCWYQFGAAIEASRKLFRSLNATILYSPLHWLDTTPMGRILNRFTRDFSTIDDDLSSAFYVAVTSVFDMAGVTVSGMIISPVLVLLVVPLALIGWRLGGDYMAGARPCKRLTATTMSTIMDLFNTSLSGVVTIRAFDRGNDYLRRVYDNVDQHAMATAHYYLFYRWLGTRMGWLAAVFSGTVAVAVVADSRISPALAGFGLSFAVTISGTLFSILRNFTFVETSMASAERIIEYTEVKPEDQSGIDAPAAWPTEGRVEVRDLVVAYADDLPPVLNGVSFTAAAGERVGIVGRTGAGKSSLTLALFRFLDARSGSILIDGLDTSALKLKDLRSRMAVIPQDPVLFSGTVKSNLDPFGEYGDPELLDALKRAHLIAPDTLPVTASEAEAEDVERTGHDDNGNAEEHPSYPTSSSSDTVTEATVPKKKWRKNTAISLSTAVSAGGLNLSAGQRQLLCLARAIISRSRIVVLDEATSAVDSATDTLIQASLRREFTGSTLLVVAHRLATVAHFDKILVLADGHVVEFGTPRELWEKEDGEGVFRNMCEESGDVARLRDLVYGK